MASVNSMDPEQTARICRLIWNFLKESEHAVCPYCRDAFGSIKAVIHHGANEHPDDHISYMVETLEASKLRYKQRTFKVFGRDIASKLDEVALDKTTGKLLIQTSAPIDSPVRKQLKINTPSKSVHSQLFTEEEISRNYADLQNEDSILHLEQLSEEFEAASISSNLNLDNQCNQMETESHLDTTIESDEEKMAVTELQKLLPFVTSHLARNGRLEEWLTFFRLIESGEFNVKHISPQLFFDVLKFTHVEDVREMRYTPEVKRFWTVGKSLFKAKFLRYMVGFKVFLNDDEQSEYRGKTMQKTDVSRLNFVVPNDVVIREERKLVAMDCKNPGIIHSNIDAMFCSSATNAFNLCIDGKKIASGFGKRLGDVNLFGHESEPTFRSRTERFEVESCTVENANQKLCGWFERDITKLSEVRPDNKQMLHNDILNILSINTNRLKELKQLKVRRQLSLEKLMKLASEPWQKSKYGFAISSIKTHLHDINRCIQDILDLNTKLATR